MSETWRVPGFSEVDVLGTGGFGRVVLAKHEGSGRFVAIKYLHGEFLTEARILDGFRREAWLLHGVMSPHVVRLFEFIESPQGAALVMEAVPGVSLRALLAAEKTLAPESALAILKGSLLGLAAAHGAGVVHRDYKPGNVLVSREGESKLVDFGLATLDGQSGLTAGSPSYMAPEQWAGRPGIPATDVYAATAVFFQCITGHLPFEAETTEQLRSLHERAFVPLDAVPEQLRPLIARGMAKDPAWRPAGAEVFVAELEATARAAYGKDWERRGWKRLATAVGALTALTPLALLATGGVAAAPVTAAGATGTGVVAATVGKILVAVLAIAALVTGGLWIFSGNDDPPPQAALSVTMQTAAGQDSALPITYSLQYPQVSGHADAAAQQRINDGLRAPIDKRLQSLRQELADRDILGMVRDRGDVLKANTTAKVLLQTPRLLSVRYEHTLDSAVIAHSSWQFAETVTVDLATGKVLGPQDVFRPEIRTASGMETLTSRLSPHTRNGFCRTPAIGSYGGDQVSIDAAKRPGGGDHVPRADIGFTTTGVDFVIKWYELGCDMASGQETVTLPYAEAEDLLQPQLLTMLDRQAPASSSPPRPSGKTYTNPRFGFSTLVPEGYAAAPYRPANGEGIQYTNAGLGATLTVWGSNISRTAQEILSETARDTATKGGQVTHQQVEGTTYSLSGYDSSGQIFYERGYTGPGSLARIRWSYPRTHKAELDAPVETTVDAFRPGDLTQPH